MLALCTALTLAGLHDLSPALAFAAKETDGQSLHAKIIKEALGSVVDPANLGLIMKCADEKAAEEARAAGGANSSLKSMVAFVDREQKKILNYAGEADVSPASRYHCLKHFGQLSLVAEDFYSRTNYVEVQSARLAAKQGKNGFDPYSIELVDWNKLAAALKSGDDIAYGKATQAKEDEAQGKAALANTTFYKAARELAVRETSRQWEVLETLIKQRYHQRAVTILAALKQASCPTTEPEGVE